MPELPNVGVVVEKQFEHLDLQTLYTVACLVPELPVALDIARERGFRPESFRQTYYSGSEGHLRLVHEKEGGHIARLVSYPDPQQITDRVYVLFVPVAK